MVEYKSCSPSSVVSDLWTVINLVLRLRVQISVVGMVEIFEQARPAIAHVLADGSHVTTVVQLFGSLGFAAVVGFPLSGGTKCVGRLSEVVLCLGCDTNDKCVMDIHSPKQHRTDYLFYSLLSVFKPQGPHLCDIQKATKLTYECKKEDCVVNKVFDV